MHNIHIYIYLYLYLYFTQIDDMYNRAVLLSLSLLTLEGRHVSFAKNILEDIILEKDYVAYFLTCPPSRSAVMRLREAAAAQAARRAREKLDLLEGRLEAASWRAGQRAE